LTKSALFPALTTAKHASPRTTKPYDRRSDKISIEELDKIAI
jgi:hypothetical protein